MLHKIHPYQPASFPTPRLSSPIRELGLRHVSVVSRPDPGNAASQSQSQSQSAPGKVPASRSPGRSKTAARDARSPTKSNFQNKLWRRDHGVHAPHRTLDPEFETADLLECSVPSQRSCREHSMRCATCRVALQEKGTNRSSCAD